VFKKRCRHNNRSQLSPQVDSSVRLHLDRRAPVITIATAASIYQVVISPRVHLARSERKTNPGPARIVVLIGHEKGSDNAPRALNRRRHRKLLQCTGGEDLWFVQRKRPL